MIDVKSGDILLISDEQTLLELDDLSKGGLEATVSTMQKFSFDKLEYTVCNLAESGLVVVFKEIDDKLEQTCVYYPCDGFTPGTRQELIEHGSNWIFQEPGRDHWEYDDLRYCEVIKSDDGDFVLFTTVYSADGSTVIAEWEANFKAENPFLMVVETGNHVRCLQGVSVRDTEVTIFNRS